MRRLSNRTTERVAAGAATGTSLSPHMAELRMLVLGVLFTTIVLAYFYAADNYFFSTRRMTPIFRHLLMVDDSKTAWLTLAVCIVAAFWKNPMPLLKVIDFVGLHLTTVATPTLP